jgi:uncharacterized Zn finger protein
MTPRAFGQTWWGKAWIDALTTRARLDPNRLIRGRAYARGDRVSDLDIAPGMVTAPVHGSRPRPYAVAVTVPVFDTTKWTRLFDVLASQIGHLAALVDAELPPRVGSDVDLLPGPGELHTTCSCPDRAEPCKHSAAVCYLIADALDTDPFALMLLRGRTKGEVLDALRDRRQPDRPVPPGMLAREAFRRTLAPLPTPALPTSQPGDPVALPVPPVSSGVGAAELHVIATAASRRAWQLLTTLE